MDYRRWIYLATLTAFFCGLGPAFGQELAAEDQEELVATATKAELVELLPKLQKNDAIAMWKGNLVYGVFANPSEGGHLLRFVDLKSGEVSHSIKNMPHSETSLRISDGKLFVFGQSAPGGRWESYVSEVRRTKLVQLHMQTQERFLDNVFVSDGEFFGVNAGYRSVSKFSPSWWSWSWEEKVQAFSLPHKLIFVDDDVYVLEARNLGWGDERVSFFNRNDFAGTNKQVTDINSLNSFGPIRDIVEWNGSIYGGGEGKLAKLGIGSDESISIATDEPASETKRLHFRLKTTEKCLMSLDPSTRKISFYNQDLEEVDVWDLSSADEQFTFPSNFVVDTIGKRIFVKSTRPCFLCKVSEGSVYSFSAPGSEAESACF